MEKKINDEREKRWRKEDGEREGEGEKKKEAYKERDREIVDREKN
jgi:hypothetical protein